MDPIAPMDRGRLPLVLIPGLLCDAALWSAVLDSFAAERPVVVADVTGSGSIDGLAASVLGQAPAGRFALAGLSMGGYVAMAVARAAPRRVAGLALLNTTARPDRPEQTDRRRQLIAMTEAGRFGPVPRLLVPTMVPPDRVDEPATGGVFVAMARRVGPDAFIRQQTAIMGRIDSRPSLPSIRCPTTVIAGTLDTLTPPAVMREIADLVPGAVLHEIEGCGHLSPLEAPGVVRTALDTWLAAVDADPSRP